MKNNSQIFTKAFTYLVLILLLFSCNDKHQEPDSAVTFIIGSKGDNELGRGLYKYTVGTAPELVTELYPANYSSWYFSQNNGVVAFTVASSVRGNTSGIAYMYAEDLSSIMFAPVPSAADGYYYSVAYLPPKVLSDGRIAYLVALETDTPYDTWFAGMIAIYDPLSGKIELSGDPTDFVLSQPEQGNDTEDGTMKQIFAVSPDDKYIYCDVYGYGTEFGDVHRDYSFFVRYTVGTPGSYERIALLNADPTGVTGDGLYYLINDFEGLKKGETGTNIISPVLNNNLYTGTGQISAFGSRLLNTWSGSINTSAGFGELDISTDEPGWMHIIDEDLIPSPINYYSNLSLGVQYSADESEIYFGVYRSSVQGSYIDICATRKVELNENPDIIGNISSDYDMNVFIRVDN